MQKEKSLLSTLLLHGGFGGFVGVILGVLSVVIFMFLNQTPLNDFISEQSQIVGLTFLGLVFLSFGIGVLLGLAEFLKKKKHI